MVARSGANNYHLGWRANGDSFDVALAVNRVLAAGRHAWRLCALSARFDTGDYLVELTDTQRAAISALGLEIAAWDALCRGAGQKIATRLSPHARPHVSVNALVSAPGAGRGRC